jgi:hypothetical protein
MGRKKSIESSLLSHERALIRSGKLKILESSSVADQSNTSSNGDDDFIRLYALMEDDAENNEEYGSEYDTNGHDDSSKHENPLARTKCYRSMADAELLHLVAHNEMPSTLPFQTLFHGRPGLNYCACRLKENDQSNKNGASAYGNATTVVEFDCDENFVDRLVSIQCKVLENEDTAKKQDHDTVILTHSMGFRASRTLWLLNDALKRGDITWRIIMVKRPRRRASRHPRL